MLYLDVALVLALVIFSFLSSCNLDKRQFMRLHLLRDVYAYNVCGTVAQWVALSPHSKAASLWFDSQLSHEDMWSLHVYETPLCAQVSLTIPRHAGQVNWGHLVVPSNGMDRLSVQGVSLFNGLRCWNRQKMGACFWNFTLFWDM